VQNYLLESRIAVMAMGSPAVGAQIHLNIAGERGVITELHHGSSEIRPTFEIMKPRMKNTHRDAVQGLKLIPKQSLVLPNRLEQTLWWR
jgi:hypothetical protein